jgi:hypothetical protein
VALSPAQMPCGTRPGVRESAPTSDASEPLDEPTRIRQALLQSGGRVTWAACLSGLSWSGLCYRMQRYGIMQPHGKERPLHRESAMANFAGF